VAARTATDAMDEYVIDQLAARRALLERVTKTNYQRSV
jgi:hypothetical protein